MDNNFLSPMPMSENHQFYADNEGDDERHFQK